MKRYLPGIIVLLLSVALYTGWTCMPIFPPNYLSGNEEYVLKLPRTLFSFEFHKILNPSSESRGFINKYDFSEFENYYTNLEEVKSKQITHDPWNNTLIADLSDVIDVLQKLNLTDNEINRIHKKYSSIRKLMKNKEDNGFYESDYEMIFEMLPKEFRLYSEGAEHYHHYNYSDAVKKWQELLDLPENERHYRSTWASYMLGKAVMKQDASNSNIIETTKAMEYFKNVRDLANNGFADSAGLAIDSYGWLGKCQLTIGQYNEAIHSYLNQAKHGVSQGNISLLLVIDDLFSHDVISNELIQDATTRKVITSWMISNKIGYRSHKSTRFWLDSLENQNLIFTNDETDRLAWLSYQLYDFERAQRWIDKSEHHTPEGKWVNSKLLLREGKIDEAIIELKSIIPVFGSRANTDVLCELGVLQLGKKQYLEALDLFMKAEYWRDAAYIAEYVLTIEELESVINQYTERSNDYESVYLPTLLSHRFVRNHQWDKALQYADSKYKTQLESYIKAMKIANDKSKSKIIRGDHYLIAGELLREYGMEMMGTYTGPDWYCEHGAYALTAPSNTRMEELNDTGLKLKNINWNPQLKSALMASFDEIKRIKLHQTESLKRFHYRYVASDLMWKAAQLLPNHDIRTAKALYYGGMYIENTDPKRADKFYKALVNRCRKLPIGQEADRLRWFPKSFEVTPPETDTPQN